MSDYDSDTTETRGASDLGYETDSDVETVVEKMECCFVCHKYEDDLKYGACIECNDKYNCGRCERCNTFVVLNDVDELECVDKGFYTECLHHYEEECYCEDGRLVVCMKCTDEYKKLYIQKCKKCGEDSKVIYMNEGECEDCFF
jgi:hypothetical protein